MSSSTVKVSQIPVTVIVL